MNAIEMRDLRKVYGDRVAVEGLNLDIGRGEFFALLGPNGAGKTTTIKLLCCLTAPTGGDALLLGDSVLSSQREIKRRINLSPQETAVAPNLTVRENLVLMAEIYGAKGKEAGAAATGMMERLGLTDRAKDRAKTLSGGLRRRLSIAMALITSPQILFLDEPTLGLDVRARRALWEVIRALKGEVTIILTTHYLEEAEALADRIGIMYEGGLRALGTAAELQAEAGVDAFEDAYLKFTEEEVLAG